MSLSIESRFHGTEIHLDNVVVLFGNKNSSYQTLKDEYPQYSFVRVKQVHGDKIVETDNLSQDLKQEADAHFTNKKGIGLCVATADCMPVFIYAPDKKIVCGIHAGWRGVANKIIPASIDRLSLLGCDVRKAKIFIGPHILMNSFEVEEPVLNEILASTSLEKEEGLHFKTNGAKKYFVDLSEVVKLQLLECDIDLENVFFELRDTKTSSDFHSYRRDKENSGRQLSFIALA